ncbi:hypothetical protein FF38_02519 [Lucilia cuprina]|uniref:Uncharacterized protein n=1 Tax=Lucilia cuprina TaxID=7375 RepID=A0A0L0CMH8_LUCCU|nr:hypothetical protein FF38_02519 [Lucilia cuprina]
MAYFLNLYALIMFFCIFENMFNTAANPLDIAQWNKNQDKPAYAIWT